MARDPMPDAEGVANCIRAAFADVPYPGDHNIVPHPHGDPDACTECAQLEAELRGWRWQEVPPAVLERLDSCLPLFTPEAWCYYLPAFLVEGLTSYPASDTASLVLMNLDVPETHEDHFGDRLSRLTRQQIACLHRWLEWISSVGDEFEVIEAERAHAALERLSHSSRG